MISETNMTLFSKETSILCPHPQKRFYVRVRTFTKSGEAMFYSKWTSKTVKTKQYYKSPPISGLSV